MKLNLEKSTSVRVRYGETDQMGYCYYGNYAQFFEVGRVETLRSIGISYKNLEDSGVMLPVKNFEIEYLAPAFYDDVLVIKTKIIQLEGAKITFEYEAWREEALIACGKTILVFVDRQNMRPIRPPKSFLDVIIPFILA